jgi:hypothetical protein
MLTSEKLIKAIKRTVGMAAELQTPLYIYPMHDEAESSFVVRTEREMQVPSVVVYTDYTVEIIGTIRHRSE